MIFIVKMTMQVLECTLYRGM